jgi:hypothetical protein
MGRRSGPFWDAMEGRAPLPRAAATEVIATAAATARVIPLSGARAAA